MCGEAWLETDSPFCECEGKCEREDEQQEALQVLPDLFASE